MKVKTAIRFFAPKAMILCLCYACMVVQTFGEPPSSESNKHANSEEFRKALALLEESKTKVNKIEAYSCRLFMRERWKGEEEIEITTASVKVRRSPLCLNLYFHHPDLLKGAEYFYDSTKQENGISYRRRTPIDRKVIERYWPFLPNKQLPIRFLHPEALRFAYFPRQSSTESPQTVSSCPLRNRNLISYSIRHGFSCTPNLEYPCDLDCMIGH